MCFPGGKEKKIIFFLGIKIGMLDTVLEKSTKREQA